MVMKMDSRLNMDTLNQDILNQDSSSLATLASGDVVLLPSADFVTDAALVRHNDDLILTLPDGREMVVEGYFAMDPRPTLSVGEGDMALTPELVSSFLQDIRFDGEGSATAVDGQGTAIGNAETVIGDAFVVRNGERVALEAGEPVFQGDIVETETGGSVKLRFVDETVFSISEDARLALDKMVFDPATSEGESLFSMLKGGFLFISGQIAKTDPSDMQVVTPVATIGIRGTIVTGTVNPGEAFEFSVIDGAIAVQPQGADAPIVMSDAFATLAGTVSATGAIAIEPLQFSPREVVERNAGQFATLSDADVSVIESAVLTSANENGDTIALDLQEIVDIVVSQDNEPESEASGDSGDSDEEPAIIVELEPVAEPEPDLDLGPVVLETQTTVEVLETGLIDSDNADDNNGEDDDTGTTVIEGADTEAPAAPVITTSEGQTLGRDAAILSGTAEPGSTVTVVGELDGDTTDTVTTTAAADGSWSVDLGEDDGFEPDNETYSYTVTATDEAGNVSEEATIELTLDFIPPEEPTLNPPELTNGYISGDDFVLSGTSTDTDTVTVTLTDSADDTVVYENVTVTNDAWELDLGKIAPTSGALDIENGDYQVTVTADDGIGNSAESDPVAIKIDHVPPVLTINDTADTLNIANSTIEGTSSDPETVTVTLTGNDGTTVVYTVTPESGGSGGYTWSIDLAEDSPAAGTLTKNGTVTYNISVTTTDAAGNASDPTDANANATGVTTDFEAPTVGIDHNTGDFLGNADSTITGTATGTDKVTVTITDPNNATFSYQQEVDVTDDGTWALDLTTAGLDDSGGTPYDIEVTATDTANNSTTEEITGVTIDFVDPEVDITQEDGTAFVDGDSTISGTAKDVETITVKIDDQKSNFSHEQEVTVNQDGTWSLNLKTVGGLEFDGTANYDITVTATDAAGNQATDTANGVTTTFKDPIVTIDIASNTSVLADDTEIGGTLENFDFGEDGAGTGDESVTVTFTDTDTGDTVIYEATIVDANNWELDLETAQPTAESTGTLDTTGETSYNITVTATDNLGLEADPVSITGVTTDFEVPVVTLDTLPENADGTIIAGTSTDSDPVTVTLDDGNNGEVIYTVTPQADTVNGGYTWSIDLTDPNLTAEPESTTTLVTNGTVTYDITATTTDAAGNEATPETATAVTTDFEVPVVTLDVPTNENNAIGLADTEISGTSTDPDTVTVTLTDTNNNVVEYEVTPQEDTVNGGYTWSIDLANDEPNSGTLVTDGTATYDITATTTDVAGNEATPATADSVTTDFVAPKVTLATVPGNAQNTTLAGTSTDSADVTVTLTDANDATNVVTYKVTPSDPDNDGVYTWSIDLTDSNLTAEAGPATLITDGSVTYNITATTTDAAGNEATPATADNITTDFVLPEVTIAKQGDDNLLGSAESTITGTAAGTDKVTVTITDPNNTTFSYQQEVDVTDDGTWSLDLTTAGLDDSGGTPYDIEVTATDAAGNAATPATATAVTTDFEVPVVTLDVPTNENNAIGLADTVIEGTSTDGENVTVTLTGDNNTTVVYEVTNLTGPNENGLYTWTLDLNDTTVSPTAESTGTLDTTGETSYNITATTTDVAGNEATPATADNVTTDFVAPDVDVAYVDNYTIGIGSTISGTVTGVDTVSVTITGPNDSNFSYEEEVTVIDGVWTVDVAQIDGWDITGGTAYDISVTATDDAGNTDTATRTGIKTDFEAPEVTLTALTNNGNLGSATSEISGTSSDPDTVTVTLNDGTNDVVYTVTPVSDGNGGYSWTLDLETADPADESTGTLNTTGTVTYNISVTTTDAAGNASDPTDANANATDVTTDFTAPTVTLTALAGNDLGSATSEISGTSSDPDTVTVTLNDGTNDVVYTVTPVSDGNGGYTWTLDLETADPADESTGTLNTTGTVTYNISVTTTDAAGNASDPTDANANATDVTTDFTAPTVTLTALTNNGNLGSATSEISGTSSDPDTVTVTLDDGQSGKVVYEVTPTGDATNGYTWTLDLETADPADESTGTLNTTGTVTYNISVTTTDAAGNASDPTDANANATGVTTDFTAPTVTLTALAGNDLGSATSEISGTSSDPDTVTVTLNDGTNDVVYTVTPVSDGNGGYTWTLDLETATPTSGTLINDGTATYNISVTTTDAAGNASDPTDANANATDVTTDFTAPTVTLTALTNNGNLGSATSEISGTSSDPDTVTVTLNDGTNDVVYTVTPVSDGNGGYTWTLDLETATPTSGTLINDGTATYNITATTTDAAGNASDPTDANATDVTTDFTAPTVGLTLSDNTVLNADNMILNGTSTDASSITVTLTYMDGQDQKEIEYTNVTLNSDGTWSVDLSSNNDLDTTGETDYTITATATDAAGNTADSTQITGVNTDFEGPVINVYTSGLDNGTATGTAGVISGTASDVDGDLTVTLTSKTDGTAVTYTVAVEDDDTWELDLNAVNPDGASEPLNVDIAEDYTISVTATDDVGNSGASTDQVITINQSASITYTELGDGDGDLDNTTPTISGTVEVGSTVSIVIYQVAADGSESVAKEWETTDVTVDGNGDFSVTLDQDDELALGDYRIEINTTDPAGNTDTVEEMVTVTLPKTVLDGSSNSIDFSESETGVYVIDSSESETITLTGADDEILLTGGGTDTVTAGDGDDLIRIGEAGVVTPDNSEATVDTGAGDDTIEIENSNGNFSFIYVTGGDNKDTITAVSAASATVNIDAGKGNDELFLTNVSGAVNGGEGDDTIIFDEVSAGLANLALDAGEGDDTVEISHEDFINLASGSDNTLKGGNGTDELVITGIASAAAIDTSLVSEFESIKLMTENSTGSSLSLGLDTTQSLNLTSLSSTEADTLVLDGTLSGINSITASDGITATIQNSDNGGVGLALDDITIEDNSHLTLQADEDVPSATAYDYTTTDLSIGENASLTLQSDSDATTTNGASHLLDVNGTFAMTDSSTLNIDLLNLSGNDLINATNILDLGDTDSASLAGTLNIYANDGIDDTGASSSQLIASTSGSGGISSTFDEILFLDGNGNNLVGMEDDGSKSTETDQALVPLYDQYSGLMLKTIDAAEITGGGTYTTNGQADAAFFSNDGTTLKTSEENVAFYGSNDHDDTFEVAGSAGTIAYYDGGEGGNDTLKLSGDQAIASDDQYSATGIMDYQVNRIETLDISTSTGYDSTSKLSLSSAMVKAMTEDTNAALADQLLITAENALILKVGQGGIDKIDLSQWGNPGSASGNGTTYTVYEKDGAKLYIDES